MFLPLVLTANPEAVKTENKEEKKDVSAGVIEHIMNHVADANEDHILTINNHHITLPLPCILYRKSTQATKGKLSIFLSSKAEEEFDGYKLDHETGRVIDAQTNKRDAFYDFSITKNVFHMMLGFVILALVFISIKNTYTKRKNAAPRGLQGFMEPIIVFLTDEIFKPILGEDKYEKFLPYLLSVFFFILINNLLGLIPFFPGGANASGNIAFTFSLAFCSFILININGTKTYWRHIFAMPGVPLPVLIILTPIEILGVFLKPAVLMLRLFGNITGGHIAVLSIASLIFILGENGAKLGGAFAGGAMALPIMLFVSAIELLVAFLQAFVFTLLSAIFISMALEEPHHQEHH
ncbi:MAG: atpB [Bacteroidota bacterium]|nr:atpB [Bacteroidota bacterium]